MPLCHQTTASVGWTLRKIHHNFCYLSQQIKRRLGVRSTNLSLTLGTEVFTVEENLQKKIPHYNLTPCFETPQKAFISRKCQTHEPHAKLWIRY